jgi:hypothetical protein
MRAVVASHEGAKSTMTKSSAQVVAMSPERDPGCCGFPISFPIKSRSCARLADSPLNDPSPWQEPRGDPRASAALIDPSPRARSQSGMRRLLAHRARDAALVFVAVVAVSALDVVAITKPAIDSLARYSPDRLVHGALWALPASALLVGHPSMLGLTSVFAALVFLPFCLAAGARAAVIVGMAGHCTSTLLVAAVVVPAAALGSRDASHIVHMGDYGASAFLAALAGGMVVLLWPRARPAALLLAGALLLFFGRSLLIHSDLMHNIADVEHLAALGVGALVTLRLHTNAPRPAGRGAGAPVVAA